MAILYFFKKIKYWGKSVLTHTEMCVVLVQDLINLENLMKIYGWQNS